MKRITRNSALFPASAVLPASALLVVRAALAAITLLAAPALAVLPEPDHSLYGTPRIDGVVATEGTVSLEVDGETLATYDLGTDPQLGTCDLASCYFVLRVAMDFGGEGDPRPPGTARPGDEALVFLDGVLAAEAAIGDAGVAQLLDVDTSFLPQIPSLSVVDAVGAESLAGPFGLAVPVTLRLSFPVQDPVTVSWQTADGTATAGPDYESKSGVATFAAGETTSIITVKIFDDAIPEADPAQQIPGEWFFIVLSDPTKAALLDAVGRVTILDDDTPPALVAGNLSVVEPPSGAVDAAFTVRLSHPWSDDVSFDYVGVAGTAGAADFELAAGSATILAGGTSTQVPVRIFADSVAEGDETFTLQLSNPVNASLRAGGGRGIILTAARLLTFVERQKDGEGGAEGLFGAIDVALSPDGAHLYAAGRGDHAVSVYAREPGTGRLSFVAAYRDGEGCLEHLGGVEALAVSPDGARVYAAAFDDGALSVFARDAATGELSLLEVERDGHRDLESGESVEGLDGAIALLVIAGLGGEDHVYVAGSEGDALSVFARDTGSGLLRFEQVLKDGEDGVAGLGRAVALAASPDGLQVYVASLDDDSVAVFDRDPTDGRLTLVELHADGAGGVDGLAGAAAVAVSPDGTSVYVVGQADGAVAVFDRAPDGLLSFREAQVHGAGGVTGLLLATDVAVSVDGAYVYATGFGQDSLVVFDRALDGSLTPLEVERDGVGGVDGLDGATSLVVSADDAQVYATGTLDNAVTVFRRDLVAPSAPDVLASTSHAVGVYSATQTIDLEWSGAVDDDTGSGVGGYWLVLDDLAGTVPSPGDGAFVSHGLDAHTASSEPQPDGERWAHLLTCDHAGNCTAAHAGPYSVDATAPSAPFALGSPSHGLAGTPSNVASVDVTWSAAFDALSGLAGYGYGFDAGPAWVCDLTQSLPAGALGVTSAPLADGSWYVHVCAVDAAGNVSPVVSAGPFVIDLTEPDSPTSLVSTSHTVGVWSPDDTMDVAWNGAADAQGLAGYVTRFDMDPASDPGTTVDLPQAADPHTLTSPQLADGDSHYFHLRTCDLAGNCAPTVTLGPFATDATAPTAPSGLGSSSHVPGVASTDTTIDVAWSGATDAASGLVGYAYTFSSAALWVCDGVQDAAAGVLSATSAALGDGSWTFHVCAIDGAGNLSPVASHGPYVIETSAPTGTVAASTSHQPSTWNHETTITVEWSGTTDVNGVAGYSYVFDTAPATVPDQVLEQAHGSDPHSAASSALADGDGYYFHLRSCDVPGNCGAAIHLGPYWIETVPPTPVTGLLSPSHPTDDTSAVQIVDIVWNAGTDATSGVAGYAVEFDQNPTWVCDEVLDVAAGTVETSSGTLGDGTWYAHVCAGDEAGNWTAAASAGPYAISTAPATVTLVATVADTGDGQLAAGEATDVPITQLYVDFSRPMSDPGGDVAPVDVTNPDSWRLIGDGGDGVVDTTDCSAVDPDDVSFAIDHVDYAATPRRANLWIDGPVALPAGRYRLIGCAAGLHDELGGALDGDGNGLGGDDFLFDFAVLLTNRLRNPNFDVDLAEWMQISQPGDEILHDDQDADDLATSGSARILTTVGGVQAGFALAQCLLVDDNDVQVGALTRMESDGPVHPIVSARAEFFAGSTCTGSPIGMLADSLSADTSGEWLNLTAAGEVPATANSVLVSFAVLTQGAQDCEVRFDILYFGSQGVIFADGFESGDATTWSAVVP